MKKRTIASIASSLSPLQNGESLFDQAVIESWQGDSVRLHCRFACWRRIDGQRSIERLAP
jgi:pyridoxine/pyridoxamine 5'-phosphate oxidase